MDQPTLSTVTTLCLDIGTGLALLSAFFPSAVGAIFSLGCLGQSLSLKQKLYAFFVGVGSAEFISPAIIEIFGIKGHNTQISIDFLVGLFALAITREIFEEIRSADLIGALKRRFLKEP